MSAYTCAWCASFVPSGTPHWCRADVRTQEEAALRSMPVPDDAVRRQLRQALHRIGELERHDEQLARALREIESRQEPPDGER